MNPLSPFALDLDRAIDRWRTGPDHPFKLRLHRWVVDSLRQGRAVVEIGGSIFHVSTSDYIGTRLVGARIYEPLSIALAKDLLADGGVFVDVGANLGLYSIILSENPAVSVVAIEPDPANFLALRRNVELNRRSNIAMFNMLVSEHRGIHLFEVPAADNRGAARIVPSNHAGGLTIHHASVRLADVLATIGDQSVPLLKIDVEGHELSALSGLAWERSAPVNVICEYNGYGNDQGGHSTLVDSPLLRLMLDKGYQPFDVAGVKLQLGHPIPEHNVWFSRTRADA